MCCCQETPQECSHTSVRRLAPTAFLQLCSPEPHSRNSPRSVGRRTGKHPATHTHDGGPLGARRAEDLEVAPRDRGRHRSAVRVKPFHETRERKVLLSDGHISRWGDCWVGAAHVVRFCSGAGYAQLQTTCNLWLLPNFSQGLQNHSLTTSLGFHVHGSGLWPHLSCSGTVAAVNCHPSFGSCIFWSAWVMGSVLPGGRGFRGEAAPPPFSSRPHEVEVPEASVCVPCGPSPPSLTPSSLIWGRGEVSVLEAGSGHLNGSGTISSFDRVPTLTHVLVLFLLPL